ncbi:MAG: polysaccharide biosynthesis tyrosine autokinase [Chloroflexi bacterium]|nr:polysaccharide biosynthesis tyrosine autokinase [Chloroflexota bacterium]
MHSLSHLRALRRWLCILTFGVLLCSAGTFVVSQFTPPVYQATATLFIHFETTGSSYENTSASLEAVPTYAQLVVSPSVLRSVVNDHAHLTLAELSAMVSADVVANTQLIKLNVDSNDPVLAAQLANEICQSFEQFTAGQLPVSIHILPADQPRSPVRPKPLSDTLIGALAGVGCSVAFLLIFEWLDHLASLEQVQDVLDMEVLGTIAQLPRSQHLLTTTPTLAETYHVLCARLNALQRIHCCKLLMVTSAVAGEGKSSIAANIAYSLALQGKHVLLVDAHIRNPKLHQYLHLANRTGLSNVFSEMWVQRGLELYSQTTDLPTLHVLTAGTLPANPTTLLQFPLIAQLFEYCKQLAVDYVIIDAPALAEKKEASVLLSLVQGVVLVIDASHPSRYELLRVKRMLRGARTPILGVVINKHSWPDQKKEGKMPLVAPPAHHFWDRDPDTPPQGARVKTVVPITPSSTLFRRPGL